MSQPTHESGPPTQDQLARAEARIAELERELAQRRADEQWQQALLEAATESISLLENGRIKQVNSRVTDLFGYTPEEAIGMTPLQFLAPESHEYALSKIRAGAEDPYEVVAIRKDGSRFDAEVVGRTVPYRGGTARVVVLVDVTERKRAEEELRAAAVRAEVLRAQAETLEQLSTPILPIAKSTVVVPLVGEMSVERGRRVLEELVRGVARSRARVAILDVTGVPAADAQIADMLLGAAQAVRLLGVEVLLTGLSTEIARSLVDHDVELKGMSVHATLEEAVAYALSRPRRR